MENIPFIKMHGLGNDFVIVDSRVKNYHFGADAVRQIADRHKGVGCDQFVVLEKSDKADIYVRFYNADGSESGACGNASRCVAWLIMEENGSDAASLQTKGGVLKCRREGDELVAIDMGLAKTGWQDIPLSKEIDTLHLPVEAGDLKDGVGVSMGNPHAVFFVNNVDIVNLASDGARLEVDELFPQKANIGAVQILARDEIKLRVWERGTGETQACGTGACAAAVAANRSGFVDDNVLVHLPGGDLRIILDSGNVTMIGPVATVFTGVLK